MGVLAAAAVQDRPFFASDAGVITLFLLGAGITAIGFMFRRLFTKMDAASAERTRTVTKIVTDVREAVQNINTVSSTQEQHTMMIEQHDRMIDSLREIVTATNATMTAHLQWSQQEYVLMRQREGVTIPDGHPFGPQSPQNPGGTP